MTEECLYSTINTELKLDKYLITASNYQEIVK